MCGEVTQVARCADFDRSPEVFDGWVETWVQVGAYFDESGWEIEWTDPPG